MFAEDKTITLEGTMKEVAFANPHSLFFIEAKPVDQPNAAVTSWSVEGPRPRALTQMGWQPDTIKAGDKVRITGHPRRDGKPQIVLLELTDEKGHRFVDNSGGAD
jgi:hypothetical protein